MFRGSVVMGNWIGFGLSLDTLCTLYAPLAFASLIVLVVDSYLWCEGQ